LGINAEGLEKVVETDGNCSGDVASSVKHRWYSCSK